MAINSLNASSYGLSGLVSGIDTQSMVEKMLSGTQAKIDKAMQKKTQLQYKQTSYRDVISKLKTLQESYLSFTSGTNLLSSSFYNTMKANLKLASGITNAAFSVTASSNASVGNTTVDYIQQLAAAKTKKTTVDATGDVDGTLNKDVAAKIVGQYTGSDSDLVIKVGGKGITIKDAALTFGGKTQSEIAKIINDEIAASSNIAGQAEAKFVNNKLQIVATDPDAYITISGYDSAADKNLSMKMFGTGVTSLSGKGTLSATVNSDLYQPSFEVNLDGRQQTIYLDLEKLKNFAETGDPTANLKDENDVDIPDSSFLKDIQNKLLNAFGSGVGADMVGGKLTFTSGAASQKFTITGNTTVMGMLGMKSGISNKLNTTMALKELNFDTALQGDHHTFSINGVEFSYDSKASLSSIMADINASKAGVKISYLESEDRFVIQNSETGATTRDIEIAQTEGNLMSVLFGVKGGATATGQGVQMEIKGTAITNDDIKNGGVFTFNVNGSDYKFTANRGEYDAFYTTESLAKKLNSAFADTFGVQADGTQNVVIEEKDGVFSIRSNSSDYTLKTTKYHKDTNTHQLGFDEGQSTVVNDGSIKLEDAGIKFGTASSITVNYGSGTLTFGGTDLNGLTMDELAARINTEIANTGLAAADRPSVSFDAKTGSFKFTGANDTTKMSITVNPGADGENLENLFGQMSLTVNEAGNAGHLVTTQEGQNAILSINGSVLERASNTFTVDGLTFTLESTTHTNQAAANDPSHPDYADFKGQPTQVSVTRDTEKIVEGLSEFLKLYNETVDFINDLYKADATYKDYAPLTDAQKKDMSDRDIELWEEKAKEGLLRNDPNLERVLSAMRSVMYTKPEGSSIAIYDLGITTSFYTNDGNLNPKSLSDLQAAIEKDPEAVAKLFSGEGGVMELLNNAINEATKSSYAGSGYLTSVAGSNALDTSSSISKQITAIDEQLVTLENRYWKEYDRYWKQFNQMEQLIQQMNTQSSWLSQLSG
ncbi:flagellar filament capping protein FliD [Ruminococcaceae bacterium OttesenSCG-928-A11]|nr:flagellar filament capping protein FliD [Ruminococcaceae bacterium OttesenSCG-928-A11]